MVFDPKINQGDLFNNEGLRSIFKCGIRGWMRKSNTTNTLVLVSDHTRGVYTDEWEGNIIHYTGTGYRGNQKLNFRENKVLNESHQSDVGVFLFEVFRRGEYVFQGEVTLERKPYKGRQTDLDGKSRYVWIFPLKLIGRKQLFVIPEEAALKEQGKKERKALILSDAALKKRLEKPSKRRITRYFLTKYRSRNANVVEHIKRQAKGICELCGKPAPFKDVNGIPFLEVHHIILLSKGGGGTIKNAAALCPNCHRKMHSLNLNIDRDKLLQIASKHIL